MKLEQAKSLAERIAKSMTPHCERVEIAGSIRRNKEEVKDIEIVAVPKWEEQWRSLLLPVPINLLHDWALATRRIRWIKPGTSQIVSWQPKPDGKYWRGLVDEQIKLDLFIAGADNFGIIYVIRTGSAEFTTALVTHAKRIGVPSVDGYLTRNGERLATPEERDVFNVLNLEYVEPEMRRGGRYLSIKE